MWATHIGIIQHFSCNGALILALAICGLISLGPASCPKKDQGPKPIANASETSALPGTPLPQPPQRIYDERFGITLIVPADWRVTRRETDPVILATAPNAGPFGPAANVVVEELNQRISPYDYLVANIPAMRMSLPGLVIKEGGLESSPMTSTAWIHYTYPRGEITVEALAYCRMKDYRAYVVTTTSLAEEFKNLEPLFRTIGRSLRFD